MQICRSETVPNFNGRGCMRKSLQFFSNAYPLQFRIYTAGILSSDKWELWLISSHFLTILICHTGQSPTSKILIGESKC